MGRHQWLQAMAGAGLILLLLGACDEKKTTPTPAPSAPVAASTPAATRPSASAVASRPAKPRVKRKLEDCPKKKTIDFPSPAVEEAVRYKLRKKTGAITTADLLGLRSLNLTQIQLDELDVCLFGHMTQLRELFLGPGKIDDLSPIERSVHLETLRASNNPIEDLAPLAKMPQLDRLDLAFTNIRDLAPLANLTNLTMLQLDDTAVSDVTPLAKLTKLRVLILKNTRVKDLKPLRGLKELVTLDVRGAPVQDTTVVMRPGLRIQEY